MIFIKQCFAIVIEVEIIIFLFLIICIMFDEVRKRQNKAIGQEEKKEEKIEKESNLNKTEKNNIGKNYEDNESEEGNVASTVDVIKEEENIEENLVAVKEEGQIKNGKTVEDVNQLIKDDEREQEKRIGAINGNEIKNYGFQLILEQKDNGELRVVREEGAYSYVIPEEDILNEASYKYSALISCFVVRQTIEPGKKYKIAVVREACLEKRENEYIPVSQGELRLFEAI